MNHHVLERPATFSVDRISQILTAFDRGIDVTEISDVYNVDLRRVHSVIQAAQRIAMTYVTTKSCPRLYSSESRSLSVPMPAITAEVLESARILHKLSPPSGEPLSAELKRAIHEFLKMTTHAHRYVSLSTPEQLKLILDPLQAAVQPNRWLLIIEVSDSMTREKVQQSWGGAKSRVGKIKMRKKAGVSQKYLNGIGRLFFLAEGLSEKTQQWMKEQKYSRYSSRAMQAALHSLAIYNLSLKLYEDAEHSELSNA